MKQLIFRSLFARSLFTRFPARLGLMTALVFMGTYSWAANPSVALSYKSITSVAIASPDGDTDVCPAGQVPVETSGTGNDTFGAYTLTEDLCLTPATAVFNGTFKIQHGNGNSFSGKFNGKFIRSGQILEVHATWRVTGGTGIFLNASGAGTGKGVATIGPAGPGPGALLLDGSLILPNYTATGGRSDGD